MEFRTLLPWELEAWFDHCALVFDQCSGKGCRKRMLFHGGQGTTNDASKLVTWSLDGF